MSRIKLAGLILAAGRGSRFTDSSGADAPPSKMLAKWQGAALVTHAVVASLTAGLDPVIVVTGHAARDVEVEIGTAPVRIVYNSDFETGLASSLKAGVGALPADVDAVVILLGDMPMVSAGLIFKLQAAFKNHPHVSAVVPTRNGRRGNPVLLARKMFPRLANITGDRGAAQILGAVGDGVLEVAIEDDAITFDVDTVDALRTAAPNL